MGSVAHVGELLHLVGPQHGPHRLAGGQILIQPGGDHLVKGQVGAGQVQQHPAAKQPVGDLPPTELYRILPIPPVFLFKSTKMFLPLAKSPVFL